MPCSSEQGIFCWLLGIVHNQTPALDFKGARIKTNVAPVVFTASDVSLLVEPVQREQTQRN